MDEALDRDLKTAWHRFVDALAPYRADLHRYCLGLTGNVWDAEDVLQDALTRSFARWGVTYPPIRNPKAYLIRVATNVWIDACRRGREPEPPVEGHQPADEARLELRDAATTLYETLSPQARAAIVLKEVFEFTNPEIADALGTTTGAVKSALHRGRAALAEPCPPRRNAPTKALVDRFVELFAARDLEGLLALFSENATAENLGNSFHIGNDPERGFQAVLIGCMGGHPDWPEEHRRPTPRLEAVVYEGEPLALAYGDDTYVRGFYRFDAEDGRITRFRSYGFCPETVREVTGALGRPMRSSGVYRAPTPAPGLEWDEVP